MRRGREVCRGLYAGTVRHIPKVGPRSLVLVATLLSSPAPAQVVLPGAPVGAASAGRVSITTRVMVSDVQVSEVDGAATDPATLEAIRRDLTRVGAAWTVTLEGKAFTAVVTRTAQDVTLRSTLVLGPAGQIPTPLRVERRLTLDGVAGPAQVEARSLPPGWPVDPAWAGQVAPPYDEVDASALFDVLLYVLAASDTRTELHRGVAVPPLPVTVVPESETPMTSLERRYGPWTLTTGGRGTLPRVTLTLGSGQGSGTVTRRGDGLPGGASGVTILPVHVTLVSRGVQVTATVTVRQRVTVVPG